MNRCLHGLLFLLLLLPAAVFAQVGIGTTNPRPKAALEISDNTRGFLLPRMSGAQRATLGAALTLADIGMMVGDTSQINGGLYIWVGTSWQKISTDADVWVKSGSRVLLDNAIDSVGIGTSNPQFKLHVEGNMGFGYAPTRSLTIAQPSSPSFDGGVLTIAGGKPGSVSGSGGDLILSGGDVPNNGATGQAGGTVQILGGAAGNGFDNLGGNVEIKSGGVTNTQGVGGSINIGTGDVSNTGNIQNSGVVTISTGKTTSEVNGEAGGISIKAGDASATTGSASAGGVSIRAGKSFSNNGGGPGEIVIASGATNSNVKRGGDLFLFGGNNDNNVNGLAAGNVVLRGGYSPTVGKYGNIVLNNFGGAAVVGGDSLPDYTAFRVISPPNGAGFLLPQVNTGDLLGGDLSGLNPKAHNGMLVADTTTGGLGLAYYNGLDWQNVLYGAVELASQTYGTLPVNKGGTGSNTAPTNGQLLIGNAGVYNTANLTPGAGINISNGPGSITISTTGGSLPANDQNAILYNDGASWVSSQTSGSDAFVWNGSRLAVGNNIFNGKITASGTIPGIGAIRGDNNDATGIGVEGQHSGTGTGYGVFGFSSGGNNSAGIRGAFSSLSQGYGVSGFTNSGATNSAGVRGDYTGSGSGYGVWGVANGTGSGIGVRGEISGTAGNAGVVGSSVSSAAGTAGVRGTYSGTAQGVGVLGTTSSNNVNATGVTAEYTGSGNGTGLAATTSSTSAGSSALVASATAPAFAARFTGNVSMSTLTTGVVKSTAGVIGNGLVNLGSEVTGTLPTASGGTGTSITPANGQILIGNGSGFAATTITQGTGIAIANGPGSITISAANGGVPAPTTNAMLYGTGGAWTASSTSGANALIYDGFNLGLGTSPAVKFHVAGNQPSAGIIRAENTNAAGYGVEAYHQATGTGYGVYGRSIGGANAAGVYGIYAGSNLGYGVIGISSSATFQSSGVYGQYSGSGAGFGVWGQSSGSGSVVGVKGEISGVGGNAGVFGTSNSSANGTAGIRGLYNGTAVGYAVLGEISGSATGAAIRGTYSGTGSLNAIEGVTSGSGGSGVRGQYNGTAAGNGVYGYASTNTSGATGVTGEYFGTSSGYGVYGVTSSSSTGAVGVYGVNLGAGAGVYGFSNGSTSSSRAVQGIYSGGTSGAGVYGQSTSSASGSSGSYGLYNGTNLGYGMSAASSGTANSAALYAEYSGAEAGFGVRAVTFSTDPGSYALLASAGAPALAGRFNGNVSISSLSTGVVRSTAGLLSTGPVDLSFDVTGILPMNSGGTGVNNINANSFTFGAGSTLGSTTAANDGEILIGRTAANPVKSTLTAGSGISINNGPGSIQISATGGLPTGVNNALLYRSGGTWIATPVGSPNSFEFNGTSVGIGTSPSGNIKLRMNYAAGTAPGATGIDLIMTSDATSGISYGTYSDITTSDAGGGIGVYSRSNSTGGTGNGIGYFALVAGTSTGSKIGTRLNVSGSGSHIGAQYNLSSDAATTSQLGLSVNLTGGLGNAAISGADINVQGGANTGSAVGLDISTTGTGAGTHRGLVVNVAGGATNYAAILNGGNVGIGTTTPAASLQVTGTTYLNSGLQLGAINVNTSGATLPQTSSIINYITSGSVALPNASVADNIGRVYYLLRSPASTALTISLTNAANNLNGTLNGTFPVTAVNKLVIAVCVSSNNWYVTQLP
jgi:hypothetical protein